MAFASQGTEQPLGPLNVPGPVPPPPRSPQFLAIAKTSIKSDWVPPNGFGFKMLHDCPDENPITVLEPVKRVP